MNGGAFTGQSDQEPHNAKRNAENQHGKKARNDIKGAYGH